MPTATNPNPDLLLLFGNQLFHPRYLPPAGDTRVLLVEDEALCRRYRYHKQKLSFLLGAMRDQVATLTRHGYHVEHIALAAGQSWQTATRAALSRFTCSRLLCFEVESQATERRLVALAETAGVRLALLQTPMFLASKTIFDDYMARVRRPMMASFYREQRTRLDVLMQPGGEPIGGRWSFDADNRARLPAGVTPTAPVVVEPSSGAQTARATVIARFAHHPGNLEHHWLPTTHSQAGDWLDDFLAHRFHDFGVYEDALSQRSTFVNHSVLAPLLNIGLLTPTEVIERALAYAARHDTPINSVEGFVRQIIGWREFIRGIYHHHADRLESNNAWNGNRVPGPSWYDGTTGILPLDHVIHKTLDYGWAHHIERLMVVANLMNLCGIAPRAAYRWFMELYVDAYDWVMSPNVYGMGLTSDGGIFSTKPYICGANYLRKMSDYPKGAWCDIVDGLFWRFVERHEARLRANPRLAPMLGNLPRVRSRRPEIFTQAEEFITQHTTCL